MPSCDCPVCPLRCSALAQHSGIGQRTGRPRGASAWATARCDATRATGWKGQLASPCLADDGDDISTCADACGKVVAGLGTPASCLASAQHRSCVNIAHDYIVPHPPHQPTPAHARPRPSTAHPLPTMSCIPFPRSLDLRSVRARPRCHPTPLPSRTLPRRVTQPAVPPRPHYRPLVRLQHRNRLQLPALSACRPLGYCAFLARWPRAQTRAVHVAARAQQHVAECGEREQR